MSINSRHVSTTSVRPLDREVVGALRSLRRALDGDAELGGHDKGVLRDFLDDIPPDALRVETAAAGVEADLF